MAWLWPLAERTHLSPTGGFADDALATSITPGGRLDRVLGSLERLPRTLPAGGTEPVPAVPVTLAIDPALVEELTTMAAGPYAVGGVAGAGKGTDAAVAFLARLRAWPPSTRSWRCAYGDVDADSLQAAGLADVLTRSLPGTADGHGAAASRPRPRHLGPTATPTASASPTTSPAATAPAAGAGRGGADPRSRPARRAPDRPVLGRGPHAAYPRPWPRSRPAASNGSSSAAPGSPTASRRSGCSGGAAAARTGVADPRPAASRRWSPTRRLSDLVGSAEQTPGGPRIAEQRYLAELAVLDLQAPAG